MKKALGDNQITELKLPDSDSGIRTYDYGTTLETASAGLPEYLVATVDGESKIITGVTWVLDSEFGAPGTYQFRPVLPEKYNRYTCLLYTSSTHIRIKNSRHFTVTAIM